MNTPKLVHARGSLLLKIINSSQSDSYDNRFLAFKVQTNRILFRSPEDGNSWSDLQSLMKRWYKKPEASQIIAEGQITLDALPASPFPAFYGLSLEYSPKEVVMSIEHQAVFGEGSNLSFSDLHLQFFDRPNKTAIGIEGSVKMSYRGSEHIPLRAQITDQGMAFIAEGDALDQFQANHPFLTSFSTSKLAVKSDVQRWEQLETQFTFAESGGNLIYDYAGHGEELNLRVRNRKQVKWTDKGLQLLVQHDDYKKNPKITSDQHSRRLVESIKNSGEMSVEIWMKSANLKQIGPAELISLEKNERRRNFALGQGPEGKPNKNKAKLPNGSFLNARISASSTDRDGEPGIQSPLNSLVLDTTHVVFTRNVQGETALYLNGVCCAEGKAQGSLEGWEEDLNLIIGNDTRFSGPWEGELYHLSIYSKALSEKEVHAHFIPQLYVEGTAVLAKVPAPLDSPMEAKWHIQPESSILEVHSFGLEVTNQLCFENVDMKLHIDGAGKMKPSGNVRTSLWGNEFMTTISRKGGQNSPWPNLKMVDPGIAAYFDFGALARVSIQNLELLAIKSPTDPKVLSWDLKDVGGVFINDFPDVVDGISRIDLQIPSQKVQMDITAHNHSFPYIQKLNLDKRGKNGSSGNAHTLLGPIELDVSKGRWEVSSYKKFLNDRDLNIQPIPDPKDSSLADRQVSFLGGNWTPNSQVNVQVGTAFMKRQGNAFQLVGKLDKNTSEKEFIKLEVNGCFVFGELTRSKVGLSGTSSLSILNEAGSNLQTFFEGDINFNEKGDQLLMQGAINLFSECSPLSVKGNACVSVKKNGNFELEEEVDFQLEDFKLHGTRLKIKNGDIKLIGKWLNAKGSNSEELIFEGTRYGEPLQTRSFVFKSSVQFRAIPFQHQIPAIFDPVTGDKLNEGFPIQLDGHSHAFMDIDMDVEIGERGFYAKVNPSFNRTDEESNQTLKVQIPEFQIFWPPRSENELLNIVLGELDRKVDEIFAPQVKSSASYLLEKVGGIAILSYKDTVRQAIRLNVPEIFESSLPSGPGSTSMFKLEDNNHLLIDIPQASDPADIKAKYKEFLLALEANSGNMPNAGAIELLQSRIAENAPLPMEDLLFYHYGLDKNAKQVDIKPGMRLRVEHQNYQFVPRSDKRAIQGFVGSGNSFYEVNNLFEEGSSKLSFDPFMTGMKTKISGVNGSGNTAGLLDLSISSRKSYYRLKFPDEFADTTVNADPFRATRLVGADSYRDLSNDSSTLNKNFLGRTIIIPEIKIFIKEHPVYIPIGSSLRQILEKHFHLPASGLFQELSSGTDLYPQGFSFHRLVHEGNNSRPIYKSVDLGAYTLFDSGADLYDMPLVKGDRINF